MKTVVSCAFIAGVIGAVSVESIAYPPFLEKSRKFGAKDCRFCHAKPEGGMPLSARGQWLVKEKDRRNAASVDPEWLANYKAAKPTPKKKKG